MRKKVFGRKFKRDKNARKALFRSLISSLILKEKITTTEAKAKAIKSDVDKLVTKIKNGAESKGGKNLLSGFLFPHALDKLVNEIAPRFKTRQGGYTRILRLGKRFGDDAPLVMMEWTEGPLPVAAKPIEKTAKPKASSKKAEKVKTRRAASKKIKTSAAKDKKKK